MMIPDTGVMSILLLGERDGMFRGHPQLISEKS
jgi:hypothetical protein